MPNLTRKRIIVIVASVQSGCRQPFHSMSRMQFTLSFSCSLCLSDCCLFLCLRQANCRFVTIDCISDKVARVRALLHFCSCKQRRAAHTHACGVFFVSSFDRNEFIELFTITKYEWTAVRRWHAQAHNSVVATRCDFKKLYKLKSSWKSLGLRRRRRLHTVCVWVLGSDFSDCQIRYYRQSAERSGKHTHTYISTYG